MPVYRITSPDGNTYEVTAPEGATEQDVLSYAQQNYSSVSAATPEDPYANDSAFDFSGERNIFGAGLAAVKAPARGFINTILGSVEGTAELVDAATNFVGLDDLIDSGDENALVWAANAGKDWINKESGAKVDPRYQDLWTTKFGEGVGSFASFFTPSLLLKGASALNRGRVALEGAQTLGKMTRAEKIATGAFAASSGAGEAAQRAKAAREEGLDVSEGQEDFATAQGALVGLTEMLPISRILGRVPKNIPKGEKDYLVNLFKSAGIAAAEEGGQEVGAAVLQNMIERGYNPNQEIFEESLMDDLTVGGAVGALADITLNAFAGRRKGYMTDAQKENERKAREIEARNDFQFRQEMTERKRIADMVQTDPEAFQAEADRVQGLANSIPAPTNEEVMAFNQPSIAGAVATPDTLGELYSLRIVGKLGNFFPTNTSFTVEQGEDVPTPAVGPDGTETVVPQPSFKVVDSTGRQYGQTLNNPDVASSLARNLNGEIVGQSIRGSILGTLMTSPQGYNPEQATNLFRYGFQTLNPESNNVTYAALNDAAGTTTENGYIEEVSYKDILNSPKVLVKGGAGKTAYQVTMPNGKKRLAVGLTASQELNRKREEAGLPPVNSFNIRQAREALGGNIRTLGNPSVTGIQDQLQYAPVNLGGKPAVVSQAREVLTKRKTTLAEKAKAGFKQDGASVLPDYIEFQSMDDAKRYADSLNKRNADKRFIPDALFEGKKDLFPQIKALLEAKNIDAEMDSDEVGQLVKSFTGARDAKSMSLEDQKLFYARLRNLPGFSTKTKLPVFRLRPYSPEQFVKATQYQNQNPGAVTDEGLATALGLEPTSPRIAAIKSDLQKQTDARLQKEVLKNSRLPIVEGLRKALDDYGLSGVTLRLEESLRGPDGGINEGYFDRQMDEIALAIDGIDAEANGTDEQRLNYLKEVLSHEVVHALRALDLWTAKEWDILSNAAARTIRPDTGETFIAFARRLYPEASVETQIEESVAELARAYIANKKLIGGKPRNLLERMIRLFQRLKAFVTNSGYESFEAILNDMRSGAIGARERGVVRSLRLTKNVPEGYVVADNVPEGVEARTVQDFDEAALEGAEVAQSRKDTGRRYSVKDISNLKDANGRSLKTFAEQFSDRIKQPDRTLADVDRIAKGFVEEFVNDPARFLPVVDGQKLDYESFLRMPNGEMYDPNNLEHANATDQTIMIYKAVQDDTIEQYLDREAESINAERADDLSKLSEYLNENADYSLAEQAIIMKGASKYGVRSEKEKGLRLVPIADNNRTSIAVLTAIEASAIVEEIRKGKSLKDAMLFGIKNAIESKKKSNKSESISGWKTFKKSDSEEDAAALKDGCAGRVWCTASATSTARNQLQQGDFHVYYKNGEPIVALRTVDGKLAEPPRGSLDSQFMTEEEEKIAEEALRAGRVTGGEDYLHDRDLIADVMKGNHKKWPDIDLFTKSKRKYPVGYGYDKYNLPEPVVQAIQKEKEKRHPSKVDWFKNGYTDEDLYIPEGKGIDMKYVGGDLRIGRSRSDSYFGYVLDALNDTGNVNIGIAADDVHIRHETRSFYKQNVFIETALGKVEVYGKSIVEIDNANQIVVEGDSKITVNKKVDRITLVENTFAKINEANQINAYQNAVVEVNSANLVDLLGSSVLYAGEVIKKLNTEHDSTAYIKSMQNSDFYSGAFVSDDSRVFVKDFNSRLFESGRARIYSKNFKPASEVSTLVFNGDGDTVFLFSENIEARKVLVSGEAQAFVKNLTGNLTVSGGGKFSGETVSGEVSSRQDSTVNIANKNDDNVKNEFLMNRDNSTVTFGTPFSLPQEYYDGMAVIDEKFPDNGRKFSRKDMPDTIKVDGVQRPTVNSNGQQIHNSEQEVENFWRWATEDGNNPVTDEDGRPVVLYTGTSKDLDFKKFRIPKNGAWFTTDPEEASQYAMQNDSMTSKHDPESGWGSFARFVDVNTASRVMPVYLRAKNPTVIPEEGMQKLSDPRYAYKTAQKDYFERLKFAGSDMAVFPSGKVYVVLGNDLQIKSAIGNIGTYRTDTGDIRYSRKDTGQPEVRNPNLVQRTPEVLQEAVAKVAKDTERTPKTSVPLYGENASPEALYVALSPEMGAKLGLDDKKRYSRRENEPQYPPNIQRLIDQTPEPSDETMGQTFIKILQMPSSKDFWDKIRQGLVYRGARLERQYRENPELAKMMADTSANALYQMTDHARAITQAVITGGIPVYQNGGFKVVSFVYKGKNIERGLLEIMAPLHSKEHGNLERLAHRYAMAIRGERLNNEGKLTPIAPGELQALEAEIQKYRNPATGQPVVREWYEMWQAYNSNIVKYLKDTGVIDDAGAQLWMKQSDYIPFYREKADGTLMHPKVFGGLHTAGQFKAVGKSSEDLNVDMVTAIVNNIDTAIAMGMKNVAQQRIIRDQINLGLASVLKKGETVGDRNSVSFKIAGKRYTAIIEDPLIYESMLPANEIPMDGLFGTMFRFPANLLRELIIRDPGYMVANMFRDTLSSYVITGAEVVPLWGTAKGFAGDIEKLRKLGVIGGYDLRMDKNGVRDFYDKEAKKMGMVAGVNWLNPVMAAWDVLGRISERSEAATRLAVYEDILKRTGNEVEAQYQALSVMNYGRRGNNPLLRMITALVPFLNARIQGLDKLYQATTGRVGAKYTTDTSGKVIPEVQRRKNFARFLFRAGLITGITALYYAMVSDDDEYENASPEIRDNYYIIPVMKGDTESGEPGLSVRLPIPFEIGIMFKVIPERLIAGIYGDDTSKDFKDSMKRALFSTLAMNPTPQAILPIGEAMVNKDFYTGRPIVPYYMENLLPEQQKTFYTNVVAEDIANKMGFSPMKVDHVLRGYGGTLGGYLMQAVDSMARENEMVLPSTEWYQKPFIKRFFATANQPGLQNKFYELKGDVDGITQTINRLNEEGRYDELATFYAKNGHMYEMRKDLNYLEKQITRLRDQRKIIEKMDIDPETKRQQIEQINMMISATLTSVPMYRKMAYDKE